MESNNQFREYQQIQELRKMWSGYIMDWMRIGVPVGGVIFGLFSYLGQINNNGYWFLPILGWIIFVIPMIMWRIMAHHIDRNIVEMYPRMLELEGQLEWEIHATYCYNNLRKSRLRKSLEDILKHEGKFENSGLEHLNYRQYKEICGGRENAYKILLRVCDKYGHSSFTSRGHVPQDWAVVFIGLVTLILASFLTYSLNDNGNFCAFILIVVLIAVVVAGFSSLLSWVLK
jgi:hypothetical protein